MAKCDLCAWNPAITTEQGRQAHLNSNQHRANYLKYFYNKNEKDILCNKKNVEIRCLEVPIKDNKVESRTRVGSSSKVTLAITNKGKSVIFAQCEFLHKLSCNYFVYDENHVSQDERVVRLTEGSEEYHVSVTITPTFVGIYQSPLVFQFQREDEVNPFYIGVLIIVSCSDAIIDLLEGSESYVSKSREDFKDVATKIYPGIRPPRGDKVKYKFKLLPYRFDSDVKRGLEKLQRWFQSAIYMKKERRSIEELNGDAKALYEFLLQHLQPHNYKQYFNLLLNLEELQMDADIRKYDMKNAMLNSIPNHPGLLSLRVLGLAEKRPSVLKGDKLYVRIVGSYEDVEYEGYVHTVNETDVLLGFGLELMSRYLKNMKFNVRFTYSKFPMQVMMRGLTQVTGEHIQRWLIPTHESASKCTTMINPTGDFIFYNRQIEQNPEQATAIKHIVAGSSLPAPYLLHGPPGTGKTVTVVEAVLQIWKLYKREPTMAYVLVSTPSNSASDLIAERLLDHIPSCDIFRFYSLSREIKQVPEKIKDKRCYNYDSNKKCFFIPREKDFLQYRVIVSTLCNSSRLVSLGLGDNHFTHVFIDESGHAVEPEALAPLVGLLKCRTVEKGYVDFGGQIVLAGDPMQLGPIIRCRVAEEFKLTTSMLERLMNLPIYKRMYSDGDSTGQFDPKLLTRLKNNYRSHPSILEVPNRLFYDGELRVCADELQRESLCHWEGSPNRRFPVLFHGVLGKDLREAKNPSYFNPQEVSVVMTYVDRLIKAKNLGLNIQPKDIGVITPYRQQVYKIRNELAKMQLNKITVGSVDEFQGQERRVIIISTVRSDPNLMSYDQTYRLGFLKNPKRFNVAITRAKCLLIVIGNPNLLSKDYHWNEFLMHCRRNGSYVGARYEISEEESDDLLQRFRKLNLLPVEEEAVRISPRANQEDPEWRNDF